MSNALEQASLIMVPSGYEDGTLGSLKPTDGTGDFTFTRCNGAAQCDLAATRVNADGNIEKGYENLLLQSNTFSDAAWGKFQSSVTGGQSGYDGTNDAWLLTANASSNTAINQSITLSSVVTLSVYAKANTADFILIRLDRSVNTYAFIDLTNGSVGTKIGAPISVDTESVGNGWYRCSITAADTLNAYIYVCDANGSVNVTNGDSIYIQDAMVNQGMIAYPYVETTTAPVAGGILEDMPRLDYSNGSCPSLLLEPERTNLIEYSEYFDGWTKIGSPTITNNYGISPEGVQNSTRFETTSDRLTYDLITINANETFSIYMKGSGTLRMQVGYDNFYPSVTSEWVRYEFTTTQVGTRNVQIRGNGSAVDVQLYGAQYERNDYPTSYIPTYGVSQTRLAEKLADGIDLGSFTSNYNTLFFDWGDMEGKSTFNRDIVRGWATNNNSINVFRVLALTGGVLRYQVYSSGGDNQIANYTCTSRDKVALVLNGSNSKLFINGSLYATYNIDVPQGLRYFIYNGLSRNVTNQFTIFPTALSDEECIALTTIS